MSDGDSSISGDVDDQQGDMDMGGSSGQDEESLSPFRIFKTNGDMCHECRDEINDQYIFRVCGRSFHAKCLYCSVCQCRLDHQQTCYVKENNLFCKQDYLRRFGARCGKCNRNIQSNDWVRRAKEQAFHLACFACDSCKRQLSTGEEFALHEGRLLCKAHFLELLEGGDDKEYDHVARNKVKRVRTTFTEDQLHVLQANFEVDSNPDGQELERIAQITGLSKRVTQVWFQNSRARQKKTQMCGAKSPSDKKETKPNISNNNSSKHNNNNINKNNIEIEKDFDLDLDLENTWSSDGCRIDIEMDLEMGY